MRGNRRAGTSPERALRSLLHAQGRRFRVDYRVRTGRRAPRPDIAFTRQRLAIFVDGCFWHGCPSHSRTPGTNEGYWAAKLSRNLERDLEDTAALRRGGWSLRVWEHERPEAAAANIDDALAGMVT
jgi:DNA mismatch endonuclease (patch repair protein)